MRKRKNIKQQNMKPACRDTGSLLLDYACHTGELDKSSRELVRKHLTGCPDCCKTVKDISSVVCMLRAVPEADKDMPSRLSVERRRRIMQSLSESRD